MLVPFGVVTVTSTVVLGVPAGAVTVICVALLGVRPVAATVPNLTDVAPVKLVPEMTTELPPPAGPVVGLSPDTVGWVEEEFEQLTVPASSVVPLVFTKAWSYLVAWRCIFSTPQLPASRNAEVGWW